MTTTTTTECRHQPVEVAGIQVIACGPCGTVEWLGANRSLEPAEGIAALFGGFRLVSRLPAVRAPGDEVLMYRAPSRRARTHLRTFPPYVWMKVDTNLWLSHDGEHLLLVPTTPLLLDNLTDGATGRAPC